MSETECFTGFWGHIEELRRALLHALAIILMGFFLIFWFHDSLFDFLTASVGSPIKNAEPVTQLIQRKKTTNFSSNFIVYALPKQASSITIEPGIEEIEPYLYRLPAGKSIEYDSLDERRLLVLNPLEGLAIVFNICFWTSLAITSPLWSYRILMFILPGLKRREKTVIIPFLLGSFLCMAFGISLARFITIPIVNDYLDSFNQALGNNVWSLSFYLDYAFILMLGHAIAFELSLILLFMTHFNFLSVDWLVSKRRGMIVGAFILGAFLTPPDIATQFMLAIPLIGIYEIAIVYAKLKNRKRQDYRLFNANVN